MGEWGWGEGEQGFKDMEGWLEVIGRQSLMEVWPENLGVFDSYLDNVMWRLGQKTHGGGA